MASTNIETVDLEPQPAMVVRRKVAITEFAEALNDIFPRVFQHITGAGQQPTGMPFMRYFSMDGVACDIAAGMPVSEAIPGAGDIEPHLLPGGKALTALHVGAYEGVGSVWGPGDAAGPRAWIRCQVRRLGRLYQRPRRGSAGSTGNAYLPAPLSPHPQPWREAPSPGERGPPTGAGVSRPGSNSFRRAAFG